MMLRRNGNASPLWQLRNDLDRQFTGFLESWPALAERALPARTFPAVNLWEDGDSVLLEAEVPGLKSENLTISVVGSELTLQGSRDDAAQEGTSFHRRERAAGPFTRVVRLPYAIDSANVQAELYDGVLKVTLPKHASAKPRKIKVEVKQ
jgi:HSP20 family protein